jgi:hypothetical protein
MCGIVASPASSGSFKWPPVSPRVPFPVDIAVGADSVSVASTPLPRSLPLCFQTLAGCCSRAGGFAWTASVESEPSNNSQVSQPAARLAVFAVGLLLPESSRCLLQLPLVAENVKGITDVATVAAQIASGAHGCSISAALGAFRLTKFDPNICAPVARAVMLAAAAQCQTSQGQELLSAARLAGENACPSLQPGGRPVKTSPDSCFDIARLLLALMDYDRALNLFELSLKSHGPLPATLFNSALCLYYLGQFPTARDRFDRVIAATGTSPAVAAEAQSWIRRSERALAQVSKCKLIHTGGDGIT